MKILIYILFAFFSLNVSAQWEKTGWQCEHPFEAGYANEDTVLFISKSKLTETVDFGKNFDDKFITLENFRPNNLLKHGDNLFAGKHYSTDNGESWHKSKFGEETYLSQIENAISVGSKFYIATHDHIYESSDLGRTWTKKEFFTLGKYDFIGNISTINNKLIVNSNDSISISSDGGETWNAISSNINSIKKYFAKISSDGDIIAIATEADTYNGSENEMHITADLGKSWIKVEEPPIKDVYSYTIHVFKGKIFAAFDEKILISEDLGQNWREIDHGIYFDGIWKFFNDNSNLYAICGNKIYVSEDTGETWRKLYEKENYNDPLAITSKNGKLYAATNSVSMYSSNREGLYYSEDEGKSWKPLAFPDTVVNSIGFINDKMIAGTNYGIFSSDDEGKSWEILGLQGEYISNLLIQGDTLLTKKLFLSTDAGETWNDIKNDYLKNNLIWSFDISGDRILAGTSSSVYLTNDLGDSWQKITNNVNTYLDVKFGRDAFILATLDSGLIKSTDQGNSWMKINNGLPMDQLNNFQSTIVELFDDYWITGLYYRGLYISEDEGKSWNQINDGIENETIISLHKSGDEIYAGSAQVSYYILGKNIYKAKSDDLIKTGVKDKKITKGDSKLAPNPCRSTLKLQFTLEKQCAPKIKIVNVYGLPYYDEELPVMQKGNHIHDINVTEFRPGTYYLEMQCGDKVFRNKYIIER